MTPSAQEPGMPPAHAAGPRPPAPNRGEPPADVVTSFQLWLGVAAVQLVTLVLTVLWARSAQLDEAIERARGNAGFPELTDAEIDTVRAVVPWVTLGGVLAVWALWVLAVYRMRAGGRIARLLLVFGGAYLTAGALITALSIARGPDRLDGGSLTLGLLTIVSGVLAAFAVFLMSRAEAAAWFRR